MTEYYTYFTYIFALLIGLSLGLTGGGGSILTVPVLVYITNIQPVVATAYSLFIVGFSSLVGTTKYYHKKMVDVKTAFIFALPAFITVWLIRKFVIHSIPEEIIHFGDFILTKDIFLMLFFALIMLVSAIKLISGGQKEYESNTPAPYKSVLFSGVIVGILSGLVGAGGGFLIVPALVFFMKLPMKKAVGTSLLIVSINSLIGFTGDLLNLPSVNWQFLLIFSGISSLGVFIGIYISKFLDAEKLKKIFGYFVLTMAIIIVYKELMS
jgi:uncharacterized membrane protein YfcA